VKICEHCHAPIHIETAMFTEFTCGAGFEVAGTELQTWECDEANRAQRIEDNDGRKDDMRRTDRKGATA